MSDKSEVIRNNRVQPLTSLRRGVAFCEDFDVIATRDFNLFMDAWTCLNIFWVHLSFKFEFLWGKAVPTSGILWLGKLVICDRYPCQLTSSCWNCLLAIMS